ncbi:MAG: DUF4280 domain-containing protein [Flavobacteriaceae bacterium]|nr:DUF4280 domain-containing protein [Flavobacteriaceae bacterium]
MSEKHFVCVGAMCSCQFGNAPDTLLSETQDTHFINDADGKEKYIVTHKELQQPLQNKTFGTCNFSYPSKPCKPQIQQWQDYYDNMEYACNGGSPLLETSKAICAIAGSPCIQIDYHGQQANPTASQAEEQAGEVLETLNPVCPMTSKPQIYPTQLRLSKHF